MSCRAGCGDLRLVNSDLNTHFAGCGVCVWLASGLLANHGMLRHELNDQVPKLSVLPSAANKY